MAKDTKHAFKNMHENCIICNTYPREEWIFEFSEEERKTDKDRQTNKDKNRGQYLVTGLVAENSLPAGGTHTGILVLVAHRPVLAVVARIHTLRTKCPQNARWNKQTRHGTGS